MQVLASLCWFPGAGLSILCCIAGYWQNDLDSNLYVNCHNKQAIYGVQSYHTNHHEDRRWHFNCKDLAVSAITHYICHWTGYKNEFDEPLSFRCPVNYVMTGVSSYHSNHHEDRRWRFKCCSAIVATKPRIAN